MKSKKFKIIFLTISLAMTIISLAYADQPDSYQNSSSNNIAYDVTSKFYLGANVAKSYFDSSDLAFNNQLISLDNSSFGYGFFIGYKFNSYFALEGNFQRLGKVTQEFTATHPVNYDASIYNFSANILLAYPIISHYHYTISPYAQLGYGYNFTAYQYTLNRNQPEISGNLNKGAYNAGLGFNVDFRSNFSTRLGYTRYQAYYPLLANGNQHAANVFTLGIYYNFI